LTNFVKVIGVLNENLNAHLETEFVQVEVNTSDLGILHHLGHTLGRSGGLNSVTINKHGFLGGLTVSLEDVDVLDGVLGLALGVGHLDVLHSIDNHVGEEVSFTVEELGGHGGLGTVDKSFAAESVGLDGEVLGDEVD
jgi:hypothetical protein